MATPVLVPPTAPTVAQVDQRPGNYIVTTGETLPAVFVSRSLVFGVDALRFYIDLQYAPLRGSFMFVSYNGVVLTRDVDFVISDTQLDLTPYLTNTVAPVLGDKITIHYLGEYIAPDAVAAEPLYREHTEKIVMVDDGGSIDDTYTLTYPPVTGTTTAVYLNGLRLQETTEYVIEALPGNTAQIVLDIAALATEGIVPLPGWVILVDEVIAVTPAADAAEPTLADPVVDSLTVTGALTVDSLVCGATTLDETDFAALKLLV